MDLSQVDAVVIDVDGTLVDSNYHHTLAWSRAFAGVGAHVELWRIHRAIGMGGDQLVAEVGGKDLEEQFGDELRDAWQREFEPLLEEIQPFEGVHDVLQALHDSDVSSVLASSSPRSFVEHYLDVLDARKVVDAWTTADDAEASKPEPDLVQVAMKKVGARRALMIGDSPWDAVAAKRAGVDTWGVLTGGFPEDELRRAGTLEVYESFVALAEALGLSVGGRRSR